MTFSLWYNDYWEILLITRQKTPWTHHGTHNFFPCRFSWHSSPFRRWLLFVLLMTTIKIYSTTITSSAWTLVQTIAVETKHLAFSIAGEKRKITTARMKRMKCSLTASPTVSSLRNPASKIVRNPSRRTALDAGPIGLTVKGRKRRRTKTRTRTIKAFPCGSIRIRETIDEKSEHVVNVHANFSASVK